MADTKNLLSPEELDALASGIEDGSIQADTGINGDLEVVKHDLTSEDSSLGMNLGALNIINERFVRHLKTGILDVLRAEAKVSADKVEVMPYREYIASLQSPTALNIVSLNPLRGNSLAVIEPSIIFAVLDNWRARCRYERFAADTHVHPYRAQYQQNYHKYSVWFLTRSLGAGAVHQVCE